MTDQPQNLLTGRGNPPTERTGVYACRVDAKEWPGFHEDIFLLWHSGVWSYLGSDQNFRGDIRAYVGPLPRTRA